MKQSRLYTFYTILFIFFCSQTAFTLFYESFTDKQNIYPIYNWKIFHTRPDKYLDRHYVLIKEIDKQSITPPMNLLHSQDLFPNLNWYSMAKKVHRIGWMRNNRFENKRKEIENDIKKILLLHHDSVQFELRKKRIDPIEFYTKKEVISDDLIEVYNFDKK